MNRPSRQVLPLRLLVLMPLLVATVVPPALAQQNRAPVRDRQRTFQKRVQSWQERKRMYLVMQRRDFSCGAAALATLLTYFWGDPTTEVEVLRAVDKVVAPEEVPDRIKNGLSLTDLRRAAVEMGYQASLGKLSFSQLAESKVPLIVGITVDDYDHFVVYRGTDWTNVYLGDPIRGNLRVSAAEFVRQWQQNAVLAVAKPGAPVPQTSPLHLRSEEIRLGQTNRQMVRRRLSAPLHGTTGRLPKGP